MPSARLLCRARKAAAAAVTLTAAVILPETALAQPAPTVAQVQRQVEALQQQAGDASEAYDGARLAVAAARSRLAAAQHRLLVQQASVRGARDVLGQLAAEQYRSGGIPAGLELLLSDDPAQFLEQASELERLSAHQAEAVRKVTVALAALEQGRREIAAEAAAVQARQAAMAARKADVERALGRAQQLLVFLQTEQRPGIGAASSVAAARMAAAARAARSASRLGLTPAQQGAAWRAAASAGAGTASASGLAGPAPAGPLAAASGRAAAAVAYAYAKLGSPYVWGAAGPGVFDCSGLTMAAWAAAGVWLPHYSGAQFAAGSRVALSQLEPGDLVFFYSPSTHVGIYVGGGLVIHAPHPGAVVTLAPLGSMPFAGAVRP